MRSPWRTKGRGWHHEILVVQKNKLPFSASQSRPTDTLMHRYLANEWTLLPVWLIIRSLIYVLFSLHVYFCFRLAFNFQGHSFVIWTTVLFCCHLRRDILPPSWLIKQEIKLSSRKNKSHLTALVQIHTNKERTVVQQSLFDNSHIPDRRDCDRYIRLNLCNCRYKLKVMIVKLSGDVLWNASFYQLSNDKNCGTWVSRLKTVSPIASWYKKSVL